jgi:hypothetical protein
VGIYSIIGRRVERSNGSVDAVQSTSPSPGKFNCGGDAEGGCMRTDISGQDAAHRVASVGQEEWNSGKFEAESCLSAADIIQKILKRRVVPAGRDITQFKFKKEFEELMLEHVRVMASTRYG